MATTRCPDCHASLVVPEDPTATSMRCGYCGATVALADAEARRRHALEREREARLFAQAQAAEAREARREARDEAERHDDRKERRRSRWWGRVTTLLTILLAPTIIAITVFDAPARLGCGASGADRLTQVQEQLRSTGCTVLAPIRSTYATGTVSTLVKVDAQCIRVLAAGAGDHHTLGLKLYAADGKELAHAGDTLDPQLAYCAPAPTTLRYEVVEGPAAKGRLSHLVMACPPPPPASGK